MKRANATRNAAQMIDVRQFFGDCANQEFICEPMSQDTSPSGFMGIVVDPETPVAVALSRTCPNPAIPKERRELRYWPVLVDLRPAAFFCGPLAFVTLGHTATPIQWWSRAGRFAPRRSLYRTRGV